MSIIADYTVGLYEQHHDRLQALNDVRRIHEQRYDAIASAISGQEYQTRTHSLLHEGERSKGKLDVLVEPQSDILRATVEDLQSLDVLAGFEVGEAVSQGGGRHIVPSDKIDDKIAYCNDQLGEGELGYITLFNTVGTGLELFLNVGAPREPLRERFGRGLRKIYEKVRNEY